MSVRLVWYLFGVKNCSDHAHKTEFWYLLGIIFKISNDHFLHFCIRNQHYEQHIMNLLMSGKLLGLKAIPTHQRKARPKHLNKERRKRMLKLKNRQNEGKYARVDQQDTQRSRSNEETIIIGYSIIKGLLRDLLNRAAKRRVTVRSFPGATTTDMKHYLQPCVERNPKMIILHTGTNDLKSSTSPRDVAEKIVDLAGNMITSSSPDTRLTISSLTTRLDEDSFTKKVTDVL